MFANIINDDSHHHDAQQEHGMINKGSILPEGDETYSARLAFQVQVCATST